MTQHDHDDIHEAILAVQAELPSIPKDATADTGKYTYNYMRIERLYQELLPILHDHGLVWIVAGAEPSEGRWIVGRLILVGADQGVESYWPLPASDDPQLIGASMTYGKRYMLCGLVGLVGEEDRDGLPPQQQESSDASSDRWR